MKDMKTIQGGGDTFQRLQDNVQNALTPLLKLPISDGVLITGIMLKAGQPNKISHTLSRQPRLWILADQSANANVWRTGWDALLLTLQTSADCTVALWVA
jgi:hypothetical protein